MGVCIIIYALLSLSVLLYLVKKLLPFINKTAFLSLPIILGGSLWSIVIFGSLFINLSIIDQNVLVLANERGQSFFRLIDITRLWNANHGGLYAPISLKNQPTPYLEVPDRDVITNNGAQLTKINPAYMTRQISELAMQHNGVQFHITSLKPIRPENKPDDWERQNLIAFEQGTEERIELIKDPNGSIYRYMAPLFVKQACMKCHSKQGYKVGDIRGGISINIPATSLLASKTLQKKNFIFFHILLLIAGLSAMLIVYKLLAKKEHALQLSNVKAQLAYIDVLTNVYNRRGFNKRLLEEWHRAQRDLHPISLLMIDIDFFKLYNDTYGHQQGDKALKKVAKIISSSFHRPGDIVARYGGEEFCAILTTNLEGAKIIAKQLLRQVRDEHIIHEKSPIADHLTISIGVSCMLPDNNNSIKELIQHADKALYLAKGSGRNQLVSWSDDRLN